ncbi:hypothetical protein [Erwinia billingiae]|uniref:hypothetical protein n=1 Tax=Erwinia billingiae TaxID=182337 RepID=UPI00320B0B5F
MFNSLAKSQKADAGLAKDTLVAGYAKKVTSLNAAYQQGSITMADAQRQQRAAYNTIISNFPQVAEDLTKFHNTLAGAEGLGDTLAKGTAVDQQIQADTKSATATGFISPGMSQEQQQDGLNKYRQQQQSLNAMEFYGKQLGIQQQKLSMQASQESIAASRVNRANAAMDLQIKRNKQHVQNNLADFATSSYGQITQQLADIQKQVADGSMSREDGIAAADKLGENVTRSTMQVRGAAGSDYVDNLSKPIFDAINHSKDFLSGKTSAEVLRNQLSMAESKSSLGFMSDPKMAAVITGSKLLGSVTNSDLLSNYGTYMVDMIKKNQGNADGTPPGQPANPTPSDSDEKAQVKVYTDTLKDAVNGLDSKNPAITDPKGAMADVNVHVNQVVKGVGSFAGAHEKPSDYNNVVDFFASPEFLKYQRMGGTIDATNLEAVKNITQVNYLEKLMPAVREEWDNSKVLTGVSGFDKKDASGGRFASTTDEAANKAIQYVWTGQSIQFKPAPGLEQNPAATAKARELQQKLAPLINRSVLMRAHLDGSEDYDKYFKESEAEMFGGTATAE